MPTIIAKNHVAGPAIIIANAHCLKLHWKGKGGEFTNKVKAPTKLQIVRRVIRTVFMVKRISDILCFVKLFFIEPFNVTRQVLGVSQHENCSNCSQPINPIFFLVRGTN